MNIALRKILDVFAGMGYEAVEGPEVELDHFNFELMNIPKNHPARDAQDTFYVDDNMVLRTHTSPVQARIMTTRKPPIRIVSPGRVYRADEVDHPIPVFHQIEGLVIDENISIGDLKGTLDTFAQRLYGKGIQPPVPAPPSSPSPSPSAEVDLTLRDLQAAGLPHLQGHRLDRGAGRGHGEPQGAGHVRHRLEEVFRLRLRHGHRAADHPEVQHPEHALSL